MPIKPPTVMPIRRPPWIFPVLFVTLVLAGCDARSRDLAVPLDMTVIRDVTVIDGLGHPPAPGMDVRIQAGRIVAIEPTGRDPENAERVIDGRGRFLIPGLIDTHAHVTIQPMGEDGRLASEIDRAASKAVLRTLLAHGITTVRNPAAPAADAVALREAVATGTVIGPEIRTAGDALNRTRAAFGPFVATPRVEDVEAEVARQAALGVDYIKVYASLSPDLVAAAITAAHAAGLEVIGHLQRTTWTEAAQLGIDHITHGAPWSAAYLPASARAGYRGSIKDRMHWLASVDVGSPAIQSMIEALAAGGVSVDPTLVVYRTKFKADVFGNRLDGADPSDLQLVPAVVRDVWRRGSFTADWTAEDVARGHAVWPRVLALTKALYDGGVLLTAGSDLPNPGVVPGVSLHEELALLVDAGIPPIEVLQIATANAARALGLASRIGSIEVGKEADLVLLTADPSVDIRNTRRIETVVVDGLVFDP